MDNTTCVFCAVVDGKLPSRKVYEDEELVVIMDINPVNPGHVLIIPKVHNQFMNDIPEHVASKMFPMAQKMNKTIRDLGKNDSSFQIEAVNLFLADGIEAGQTVYHSHLHVIPRFKGDGFKFNIKYPEKKSDEANDKLASALRSLL